MQLDEGLSCVSYGTVEFLGFSWRQMQREAKIELVLQKWEINVSPTQSNEKNELCEERSGWGGRGLNSEILWGYTVTVLSKGCSLI